MRRFKLALAGLATLAAVGFILFAAPAFADTTTVAPAATTATIQATTAVVTASPLPTFWDQVIGILETALLAILTAAAPILVYFVTKWVGAGAAQVANNLYSIALDQAKGIVMHTIANSPDPAAAGSIVGMTTTSTPIIVATNYAVQNYPAAFSKTGVTPAEFAQDLLATVAKEGGIIGTVAAVAGDVIGLVKKPAK